MPHERDGVVTERSFFNVLTGALGASLAAVAKIIAIHTIVFGLIVGVIVYCATSGAGFWHGIAATASALAIHGAFAPFILFWSAFFATAAAVKRYGLGSALVLIAVRKAEALNPSIRDANDFPALCRSISDSLDSITREEVQPPIASGLLVRAVPMKRLATRIGRRLIRVIGRAILGQLELMPRKDGTVSYATINDWLGARIDDVVVHAIQRPAIRWLTIFLAVQALFTLGVVMIAR